MSKQWLAVGIIVITAIMLIAVVLRVHSGILSHASAAMPEKQTSIVLIEKTPSMGGPIVAVLCDLDRKNLIYVVSGHNGFAVAAGIAIVHQPKDCNRDNQ